MAASASTPNITGPDSRNAASDASALSDAELDAVVGGVSAGAQSSDDGNQDPPVVELNG